MVRVRVIFSTKLQQRVQKCMKVSYIWGSSLKIVATHKNGIIQYVNRRNTLKLDEINVGMKEHRTNNADEFFLLVVFKRKQ